MMGKIASAVILSLFILVFSGSAASNIILNGTSFNLTTGDSYGLYQGYIVTLKSVGSEGSVWLELVSNNTIVKSEIIHLKNSFTYNKTNKTILSIRVDNIYSGSRDTNLVTFFPVFQYIDPDMPAPKITEVIPIETKDQNNYSAPPPKQSITEPAILGIGIIFILILFYAIRKSW